MVPQKASGGGGGGGEGIAIPHFNGSIYRGGNFLFLNPGQNVHVDDEYMTNRDCLVNNVSEKLKTFYIKETKISIEVGFIL